MKKRLVAALATLTLLMGTGVVIKPGAPKPPGEIHPTELPSVY